MQSKPKAEVRFLTSSLKGKQPATYNQKSELKILEQDMFPVEKYGWSCYNYVGHKFLRLSHISLVLQTKGDAYTLFVCRVVAVGDAQKRKLFYGLGTICNEFLDAVYKSAETQKRLVEHTRVNWFDSNTRYYGGVFWFWQQCRWTVSMQGVVNLPFKTVLKKLVGNNTYAIAV